MSPIDPRTPVIIGVGQHTQRTNAGAESLEPASLMALAARAATDDSGAPGTGRAVDSVRMIRSLSADGYRNAPLLVGQLAGWSPREHIVVSGGGDVSGAALAQAAADLFAGAAEVVVLVSGEAWYSHTRALRDGASLTLTEQGDNVDRPLEHGAQIDFIHPHEASLGIVRPIQEYPLFEHALRATLGNTIDEHQHHLGRFVERFSRVAGTNPHAWDRAPHSAAEIAAPSPVNRLVGHPYTKLMVSNEQVDMAAAIVVTTVGTATTLGVPRDRWVFPLAAAGGAAPMISERSNLHDSPLARHVGATAQRLSGRSLTEADHVDLYSCFPSAVQIQAREFGLDPDRDLTVTGGMRFSGGPWCGYPQHGLATMVPLLRADPGSLGLVSANGGAITKLVVTLLSTTPPPESGPLRYESAQPAIDAEPRRVVVGGYSGPATAESFTVMHGAGSVVESGIVAAINPDGHRVWATTTDPDAASMLIDEDIVGQKITIDDDRLRMG